jgi:hypothetical protein
MATETQTQSGSANERVEPLHQALHAPRPLQLKGVLDKFQSFDVTPVIGREFKDVNLAEWLRAPNSDELIRDLAITGTTSLIGHIFSIPLTHKKFPSEAWSFSVRKMT